MRQIKFRIWDNLKKEWLIKKVYHSSITLNEKGIGEFVFKQHPEGYTIQQYIGMKDCNNVEIFEGDIVTYQQPYRASGLTHPATTDSYRTIVAPVTYNEDSFQFEIDSYPIGTSMIKTRKDLEIIGNIFQNIDLIKEG